MRVIILNVEIIGLDINKGGDKMAIVYKCDRCRENFSPEKGFMDVLCINRKGVSVFSGVNIRLVPRQYDLCPTCVLKLNEWLKNYHSDDEEITYKDRILSECQCEVKQMVDTSRVDEIIAENDPEMNDRRRQNGSCL